MIKPHIIIPNLIEQPTWGGSYIAKLKNILTTKISNKKIGQSYELYEFSNLSSQPSTMDQPTLETGDPNLPQKTQQIGNDDVIGIQALIDQDPLKTLGNKALAAHGKKMGVLIKLTQAKGNSYQLHVKESSGNWLPKPESWYYLEPGLITLGIRPNIDWHKYQETCSQINDYSSTLSQQIKDGQIDIDAARRDLKTFISNHNPERFVNVLEIESNQSIDLSDCGIHHSWEELEKYPQGNIVYEVQKNVYDPESTIRCFDKGKIKDDGSIRQLQIEDYFKYIDRSEKANDPQKYLKPLKSITQDDSHTCLQVFRSPNYSMDEIKIIKPISNQHTTTYSSFHHIFVRNGEVKIISELNTLTLTTGYSAFIPANTGNYQIVPTKESTILKTYL